MRQVERTSSACTLSSWDSDVLSDQIQHLRGLSRLADPAEFLPQIRARLAAAGVAFVVLRPLEGMRVSGVSFWGIDRTPIVALTARHLTDDHLWFTLFHEIGHLLLHPEGEVFVDEFEIVTDASLLEEEANTFAAETLLPFGTSDIGTTRANGPTLREVARFSSRHALAPGIVVGQLQHAGILRPNQLNGLKRRYRWNGSYLSSRH
jgi:HTH-type transcriptional regulator/antitoxin HigA